MVHRKVTHLIFNCYHNEYKCISPKICKITFHYKMKNSILGFIRNGICQIYTQQKTELQVEIRKPLHHNLSSFSNGVEQNSNITRTQ